MSHKHLFRLLVYGTLKRGYWNYEAYCRHALLIGEATIKGRLYELPSGIPILQVPREDVLAFGTRDPLADAEMQESIQPAGCALNALSEDDWDDIGGEVFAFKDPVCCVPPIDRLEGFRPGRPSLYRRVLISSALAQGRLLTVWCYVLDCEETEVGPLRRIDAWPCPIGPGKSHFFPR